VEAIAEAQSAFVLGRGSTFGIAAEAALKLKETCGLHAEAFSSAEVMHGPAEIVRPGFLVIGFPPRDEGAQGFAAALERFADLGARVIVVEAGAKDGSHRLGAADAGHPLLAPVTMIHRFYALCDASARALGRNPDLPRNLHKVTETR
jgi:glucosamine--fructose-6-phosphate aminotransferase (isomerizing)